jgi:phosphate uptake regulator
MGTRQLMAFGNTSFIISLPKDWVRKNRLKKGDPLFVDERPLEITISAKGPGDKKKTEITIDAEGKSPTHLKTEITSAYINNYDIIVVTGNSTALKAANAMLHELAGIEIIEETSTKTVAKELLDINEVSLQSLVKRIDNIIRSMTSDLLVMKTGLVDSVYERDSEVNRLALIGYRSARAASENPALLRMFGMSYWDAIITKEITGRLERFGDQVKRLARMVESGALKDKNAYRDFEALYSRVAKRYGEVMSAFYAMDRQAFYALESDSRKLLKECDDFMLRHSRVEHVKMMEYLKHMIAAMNGLLRRAMEME